MKKRSFLFIAAMICMLIACNKKVTQEELIRTALELKIEQWRALQIEECNRKALADAEAYVDSMLLVRSLPAKLDTIPKPPKPNKPPKPIFRQKPDSVVIGELE